MKKILLTGDFFHDYQVDLKEGLEQNGYEVDLRFNNIHGPFHALDGKTFLKWMKYGLLPHKLKIPQFTKRAIERYNQDLQFMMRRKDYDAMLVIGAKTIYPETLSAFQGRKIFYFIDALPQYESVYPIIPLFDHHFVFEPSDVSIVQEKFGLTAHFLTLAFSPTRYYKKNEQDSIYDFSFVGTRYPKREEYLNELLSVSENLAIYGDFYKSRYKAIRNKTRRITAPFQVVNDVYNSSRVNVNIHHPQSKEGLAIRTFEIIGAGGFQLVERQKAALMFFEEDKHMAFYDNKEEFIDKASYFLKNETLRRQIAESCYHLALQKHTWKHRIKEMFDLVKL